MQFLEPPIFEESGQVEQNIAAIIMLIMGVGVATLMLIFVGVLGGQVYSETAADLADIGGTITSESLGTANATGYLSTTLDHTNANAITALYCDAVASTNYTQSGAAVIIDGADCASAAVTSSYTYGDTTSYTYVKESIQSGFKGLNITGSYLPIVVLAVIIFIVLGLVMGLSKPANYAGSAL